MAAIQVRYSHHLGQNCSSKAGGNWSDSGSILKEGPSGFSDEFAV